MGDTEHREAVRAFVRRLVHDDGIAEDLTQEALLRAHRTAATRRGEAGERTWLMAIALNLVRDHFRAAKRTPEVAADGDAVERVASDAPDAEFAVLQKEMSACIAEFLTHLPAPQQDVVALHDMAGLKHREIAAVLDISEANARVLLHRGRAAFREILERNCSLAINGDAIPCERKRTSADR